MCNAYRSTSLFVCLLIAVGLSSGEIAAIVVILLLVAVIIVMVVAVVVTGTCIYKRRR